MNYNISEIRKEFPALFQKIYNKPLVYLDNAATTQKPRIVIEAIKHYYEKQNSNIHRGAHYLSQQATEAFEATRNIIANYINSQHSYEVIFVKGATEGINLVAQSYGNVFVNENDEIIVSELEHHSNIVPWQMLCEAKGAKLKVLPINEDGSIKIEKLDELISPKTKIIAVTHISNSLGTILPVKKIIDKAHQYNIPVLIDGAQGIVHSKVDVKELDCDFYCFSGHKFYAPMGIGIVYGKEKWLDKMQPYQGGGEMIKEVTFEKTTYNDLPFKFEAGTPNVSGALGLGKAVEFVNSIGIDNIAKYENSITDYATSKLKKIEGIKIYGTNEDKASVISFLVEGIHPYDLGTIIDKMGIAVRTGHHCAQPVMDFYKIPGTVRASFAMYNNQQDVDLFVEALKKAVEMLR